MLDRMMRERPNAHTIALEGLIQSCKNGVIKWKHSLDELKLKDCPDKARRSVDNQRKLYLNRKAVIGAELAAKMEFKRDELE